MPISPKVIRVPVKLVDGQCGLLLKDLRHRALVHAERKVMKHLWETVERQVRMKM